MCSILLMNNKIELWKNISRCLKYVHGHPACQFLVRFSLILVTIGAPGVLLFSLLLTKFRRWAVIPSSVNTERFSIFQPCKITER